MFSITVTYSDGSSSSYDVRELCEENYTIGAIDAIFEYTWPTPECYLIDTFTSSHEMYIVEGRNEWPAVYTIKGQYGPTLFISTSS